MELRGLPLGEALVSRWCFSHLHDRNWWGEAAGKGNLGCNGRSDVLHVLQVQRYGVASEVTVDEGKVMSGWLPTFADREQETLRGGNVEVQVVHEQRKH